MLLLAESPFVAMALEDSQEEVAADLKPETQIAHMKKLTVSRTTTQFVIPEINGYL